MESRPDQASENTPERNRTNERLLSLSKSTFTWIKKTFEKLPGAGTKRQLPSDEVIQELQNEVFEDFNEESFLKGASIVISNCITGPKNECVALVAHPPAGESWNSLSFKQAYCLEQARKEGHRDLTCIRWRLKRISRRMLDRLGVRRSSTDSSGSNQDKSKLDVEEKDSLDDAVSLDISESTEEDETEEGGTQGNSVEEERRDEDGGDDYEED